MAAIDDRTAPAFDDEPAEFGSWLRLINHGD